MSPATATSIADAASNGHTSRRHAAPHGKNAAQRTNQSDSPYQERTSPKDNPTQALIRQAVEYTMSPKCCGRSHMNSQLIREDLRSTSRSKDAIRTCSFLPRLSQPRRIEASVYTKLLCLTFPCSMAYNLLQPRKQEALASVVSH